MNKKTALIISMFIAAVLASGCGKKSAPVLQDAAPNTPAQEEGAADTGPESGDDGFEASPEIDLNESGLDDGGMPEISMDINFTTEEVDLEVSPGSDSLSVPEVSLEAPAVPDTGAFQFDSSGLETALAPEIPSTPQTPPAPATPPPGNADSSAPPVPDAATCAQFAAAPSCDVVPANVRDLCRKCK